VRVPPIAVRVLPNGSRVSCGRLARRRKMKWTTVRARQGTTLITACQLQALVGRRLPHQGPWGVRYGRGRQSHTAQPLSNTTRHRPSASRRQIELNVPIWRPLGSRTGPLLRASVPDSRTSTIWGLQENGAAAPSKKGCQPATTAALPRSVSRRLKKTASTAT